MKFFNKKLERLYKYLYIHDGQTILMQDLVEEIKVSAPTVRRFLKWLEERELIKRVGKKKFEIVHI